MGNAIVLVIKKYSVICGDEIWYNTRLITIEDKEIIWRKIMETPALRRWIR